MSSFKKYNLSKPRKEVLKDGTEKTFWDNVGHLTMFVKDDGSESGIVELVTFASNIRLNVFPMKPRENTTQTTAANDYSQPAAKDDYSQDEEIQVSNIPF